MASSDLAELLDDDEVNTVVVATQHDTHARFTADLLKRGKNVFVEKPLALTEEELATIEAEYRSARERGEAPLLMVGFNRRFAPTMQLLKEATGRSSEPMSVVYTCNAGAIDKDSWVQDREKGGGRIIGEACHFIDAARFLAGSEITGVSVAAVPDSVAS